MNGHDAIVVGARCADGATAVLPTRGGLGFVLFGRAYCLTREGARAGVAP